MTTETATQTDKPAMRSAEDIFENNSRIFRLSDFDRKECIELIEYIQQDAIASQRTDRPDEFPAGAIHNGEVLIERINKCHKMIANMCSEGRPPRMEIPAKHDEHNEDIYICDTFRMMKEVLASERTEPQAGWQDISTAPKTGKEIWLACPGTMRIGFWDTRTSEWIDFFSAESNSLALRGLRYTPTHWMPLPYPPNLK